MKRIEKNQKYLKECFQKDKKKRVTNIQKNRIEQQKS